MRYEAPTTLQAAVQLLARASGEARVLAGGTDLLVQMKTGLAAPALLVDIKGLAGVRTITEEAGGWRIGAAVTGAELKEHAGLKREWPGVVEAANLIGSTQIQGRATLGGNLANASPAADSVPALIAADARVAILGPEGSREAAVADIVLKPRTTSLGKGEIIVAFLLKRREARAADAYLRFIPRTEMDIAVAGCGVNLALDEKGRCAMARVALGAVAERAVLVPEAGRALVGTTLEDRALASLAAAASAACRPIDDKRGTKAYRIKIAGVLARRASLVALERARAKAR
jgi:carbon-monoxide dehydrogenase medium subunit